MSRAVQGDGGDALRRTEAAAARGRERPFCADVSRADDEPLGATASRVERWLLIEYRGLWAHEAVAGSTLSAALKDALEAWREAAPRSRVLFVRRPQRRGRAGLLAFRADATESDYAARRIEVEHHDDLAWLDLDRAGDPVGHPLLLVCTHGKHDACCARYGRPLYEALCEQADDEWTWQCSHVGGDRFAGNVVVLPAGLYLGRIDPGRAWETLDELLAGRIPLDHFRGRSCYAFPVQAADHAVRRATGLLRVDDLRLTGTRREEEAWCVRFSTSAGEEWEVSVERRDGPLTHLTCSSEQLRHPRHFVAGSRPVRVA